MKYITAKLPGETPAAFPFSPFISHEVFAKRFQLKREDIIGAGFYRIEADAKGVRVETAGFSTSLNCGPHPDDAALIAASHNLTNREYPAKPQQQCDDCSPEFNCFIGLSECRKRPQKAYAVPADPEWQALEKRFGAGAEL